MTPSFSTKNGVRYRFYVSTALRGRKHNAGSVTRISASEIETPETDVATPAVTASDNGSMTEGGTVVASKVAVLTF